MMYEERRQELHQAARDGNPLTEYRPGGSLPDPRSARIYGDFWARCAPLLDEVLVTVRRHVSWIGDKDQETVFWEHQAILDALARLDSEAEKPTTVTA